METTDVRASDSAADAAFDAAFAAAAARRYADDAPVSWAYRSTRGYGYVASATLKKGQWFYKIRQVDNHVSAGGSKEPKFVFHYQDDMQASTKNAVDAHAASAEHAGFDDWVEIFRAGKHTDSQGATRTWSSGDLDQIVANFDAAQPAPLVVGHPQTDSPAWGWTSELKRAGGKLLARFAQVPQAMVDAVRDGRYRNRSVKLAQDAHGWRLIHVGMLGAAPPAVGGLAPIAFDAEPAGETYEFAYIDGAGTSLIARGMQKLRELIIAKFGQDEADQYVPQDDIDRLNDIASEQKREPEAPDTPQPAAFNRGSDEDPKMDEQLKAELDAKSKALDAANAKLSEFAATQRVAAAKQAVDLALTEGRLTPAQAAGLPEFMASLTDEATFEFAAGDDKVTRTGAAFVAEFLAKLPKQIEFRRHGDGAEVDAGDADAILGAAREYQKSESAKGIDVPWHEAVNHVMKAH